MWTLKSRKMRDFLLAHALTGSRLALGWITLHV